VPLCGERLLAQYGQYSANSHSFMSSVLSYFYQTYFVQELSVFLPGNLYHIRYASRTISYK
jgi:hypothetical protein